MAAFIPVRGGSKGIPFKNIRIINGRPLVYWVLDAAVESTRIEQIYVSTDNKEIKNAVLKYPSDKIKVVSEKVKGEGNTENAMLQFADKYEFKNIILIQATSPLITARPLDRAIYEYFHTRNINSICSVSPLKKFLWERKKDGFIVPIKHNPGKRPLRQNWTGELIENGAFYITSKSQLLKSKCRMSGNIGAYIMGEEQLFEVGDFDDFSIIETLLKQYKGDGCLK